MSVEPDVDAVEIRYPPDLPVSQRKDEIAAAIRDHQVVIVAGETGSGKTTQIPKICLELGRGRAGLIGHTQPRRIAARSVAERIASELGTELGQRVGYTVRFTDQVSRGTQVRLMTDGILLAEIQRDPTLRRYDTIIVDEAHERSLNIDFILGYLHQLLPRRPDLKVVITSATIDSARFSEHFGGAPVVEVTGRTYPVEVRYRPVHDPDAAPGTPAADPDRDQISAIVDGVAELQREGGGDVLVFLSGEREIRDTADGLRDAMSRKQIRDVDVLPLYARLSAAEQHRVFASHSGQRVVLATNVAETSLTVPGIRYVIDPGTARISRYSLRTKVQRLPIEPVSQASARQRAGRCGRVADGICLRLYSEDDFDSRPEYTDPEILRTNLASVILQMTAIGLGDVAAFPFVEPPDVRAVRDGIALLEELHAIEVGGGPSPRLTRVGRRLVRLPVDPRMARMVLEADRLGCVHEVLVIAAALSIQDPRERPVDAQQAADEQHRRFADERSDFLAHLNLWEYLREQQEELSSSAFRRMCKREFLHFLRVREWQDLHSQLRRVCKDLKIEPVADGRHGVRARRRRRRPRAPGAAGGPAVARGRQGRARRGACRRASRSGDAARSPSTRAPAASRSPCSRGRRWPAGRPTASSPAELVETSRMWARTVARVEPEWVETAAAHLVKRTYAEPHWSAKRGSVVARERVTLYGVPLVADRAVQYGRIDPETSRELFIRHALVEGDWRTRHDFFHANRQLLEDVGELEHRTRRRDIVVDDETLFSFYDKRIPPTVVSGAHFDRWWKGARRETPDLLTFTEADVVDEAAEQVSQDDFPDRWHVGGLDLAVGYRFEPGSPEDGVTVTVPAAVLNQVPEGAFEWQVPGLRHELVTELIRSLPKPVRTAPGARAGQRPPRAGAAAAARGAAAPGAEPRARAAGRRARPGGRLRLGEGAAAPAGAGPGHRPPRQAGGRRQDRAGGRPRGGGHGAGGDLGLGPTGRARGRGPHVVDGRRPAARVLHRRTRRAGDGVPGAGRRPGPGRRAGAALTGGAGAGDAPGHPAAAAGRGVGPVGGHAHRRLGERRPARPHPRAARLAGRAGARRRRGRGRRRRRPARWTGLGRSGFRAAAGRRRPRAAGRRGAAAAGGRPHPGEHAAGRAGRHRRDLAAGAVLAHRRQGPPGPAGASGLRGRHRRRPAARRPALPARAAAPRGGAGHRPAPRRPAPVAGAGAPGRARAGGGVRPRRQPRPRGAGRGALDAGGAAGVAVRPVDRHAETGVPATDPQGARRRPRPAAA